MPHSTVASKPAMVAAAATISAAGFLTIPGLSHAAPPCSQYGYRGDFGLNQANGYSVAFYIDDPRGQSFNGVEATTTQGRNSHILDHGHINGGIQGRHLDFTIGWNGGPIGHYIGDVLDDKFAHGKTNDEANPGSKSNWQSIEPMTCLDEGAAKPAPAQPAPATQKVATVTSDVDVFNIAHTDVPDKNGVQGVKIGTLRTGQQVGLAAPCQPNDWCHILASGLPAGNGFVLGHLQF